MNPSNKNESWFSTKKLKESEEFYRNNQIESPENDFSSYAMLLKGKEGSQIAQHNAVGKAAETYSKNVSYLIGKYNLKHTSIADMGCGAGFITSEVQKKFKSSKVYGFEISHDAIAYGKQTFPDIAFHQMGIEENTNFETNFDVIYCREFYAFTRTSEYGSQKLFLQNFLKHTTSGGAVIVNLIDKHPSLLENLSQLKNDFTLTIEVSPIGKILELVKVYSLARILTRLVKKLKRTPCSYNLIFRKL